MDPLPLERILNWFDSLPHTVRGNLAFFSIIKIRAYDPLDSSEEAFRTWLGDRLDYFQHVGRTIQARGLIDYIMAEEGNPAVWEEKLDRNLELLEREDTPAHMKPLINNIIPNFVDKKPDWLAADRSWRKLRFTHLTDEALHKWEQEMMLGGR
jgi:hypothetical protein